MDGQARFPFEDLIHQPTDGAAVASNDLSALGCENSHS